MVSISARSVEGINCFMRPRASRIKASSEISGLPLVSGFSLDPGGLGGEDAVAFIQIDRRTDPRNLEMLTPCSGWKFFRRFQHLRFRFDRWLIPHRFGQNAPVH